jgi:hypothetical protein
MESLMKLFAVRQQDSHQAIGFFWAHDIKELWSMVDPFIHPGDCEYKRVREAAAFVWPTSTSYKLGDAPCFEGDDEDAAERKITQYHSAAFADVRPDYGLDEFVYNTIPIGWRKLHSATKPEGGIHELVEEVKSEKAAHSLRRSALVLPFKR